MNLNAKSEVKPLSYYDLSSGAIVSLNYEYKYQWSSVPDGVIASETTANPYIDAPFENTTYNLILKAFGETISSSYNFV